jgi:hypothetical protein
MHSLAVPAEHVLRLEVCERAARRGDAKERVQREPFAADTRLGNRAERVGADEDAMLRPPERDLLPPASVANDAKLEERALERRVGHNVVRHAEA